MTSAALAVAMLAGGILTTTAVAAPVPPKKSILAVTRNGCPAHFTLHAKVIAKQEGQIQIRFQRDDGLTSAPVLVNAVKKPSGLKVAVYKRTLPPVPAFTTHKYRVLAFGAGTSKISKWSELKSDC
jgi:hypothetical protein